MIVRSLIRQCFSATKGSAYVPIRPIKEALTTIYQSETMFGVSSGKKALIYSPFLATLLEGIINDWSVLLGVSSFLFLTLGRNFFGSHKICRMTVTPNLSKFYLLLPKNRSSLEHEEQVLASQGTTFQQKMVVEIRSQSPSGWISDQLKEQYSKKSDEELLDEAEKMRQNRDGIILELSKNNIKTWKVLTQGDLMKKLGDQFSYRYGRSNNVDLFESYIANPEKGDILALETFPMVKGYPLFFYLQMSKNTDNKYQEYLTALGRGQHIVDI